jgi:hypothetical protein
MPLTTLLGLSTTTQKDLKLAKWFVVFIYSFIRSFLMEIAGTEII